MYCKQCGHEIADNEAKCSACGAKFGKGNRFCVFCGAKKETGAYACPNCGHSYTEFVKRIEPTKPEPVINKEDSVLQSETPEPVSAEEPKQTSEPIPDFGGNTSLQKIFANVNAQGMEEDLLLQQLSRQQPKPQQPQCKPVQQQTPKKPTSVKPPEKQKAKPAEVPVSVPEKQQEEKSIGGKEENTPIQQPKKNKNTVKRNNVPTPTEAPVSATVISEQPKPAQPVSQQNAPQPLEADLVPHSADIASAPVVAQKPAVAPVQPTPSSGIVQATYPPNTQPVPNGTISTPGFWQGVGNPPTPEKQPITTPATSVGAVANMRQAHQNAAKNKQKTIPDALALVGAMLAMATAMTTGGRCLFLGIAAFIASLIGVSSKKLRFVAIAGILVAIVAVVIAWATKNISFVAAFGPVN